MRRLALGEKIKITKIIISLFAILSGCTMVGVWDKELEPAAHVSWEHVTDPQRFAELCGESNPLMLVYGCALRHGEVCVIFSRFSEQDAKNIPDPCLRAPTASLWHHEQKHCLGLVHKFSC
jgi:hypothetical protein